MRSHLIGEWAGFSELMAQPSSGLMRSHLRALSRGGGGLGWRGRESARPGF